MGLCSRLERKQLIWDLKLTKVELLAPVQNGHILAYNEGENTVTVKYEL